MSTASYGTSFWDDVENTLKLDLSMEKVSNQKLLYMFADYNEWTACTFFMLALYRISGNCERFTRSSIVDEHWIFPHLVLTADHVRKMNLTLRQLTPQSDNQSKPGTTVLALTDNYTGTGFRIGSLNTITAHQDCDFKHGVMRSGHDHTKMCDLFEYSIAHPHLVALAGRA